MSLGGGKNPKKPSESGARVPCGPATYGGTKPIDKDIKRIQELTGIARDKRTKEQNEELCALLSSTGPDEDFNKRDQKNQKRLKAALQKLLKNDKLVKRAAKDWSKLTSTEKTKVAKKILQVQRKAYSPRMEATKFETFEEGWSDDGYLLNGSYSHKKNLIRLNTFNDAKFGKDFESAVAVLCHEQAHKYQHTVVDQMKAGKIKPSSPLYRQAQIWSANFDGYQSTGSGDSFDCYHDQAVERHSHVAEDAVDDAI